MLIRMLAAISGTRDGEPWPEPGVPADLPEAEAAHYVAAGLAEPVDEDVEAAVDAQETETAAVDTEPKRGRGRPRKTQE